MFRNKSVDVHQFAMIPRADVPRSRFKIETSHKTAFDSGYLVPIFVDEVLPGDSFSLRMTAFCRLATPIFPFMDNLHLDSFFFFVPSRLLWSNFKKFMGEQNSPGDSTDFTIPQCVSPAGGYDIGSIFDYFGLPTVGQVDGSSTISHNALPLRAYNLIFKEWFRDENLINSPSVPTTDGPDTGTSTYFLRRRGKRHDYFTSALPWPQKGEAVTMPLGDTAPVRSDGTDMWFNQGTNNARLVMNSGGTTVSWDTSAGATGNARPGQIASPNLTGLEVDLSEATAATINQLRQSFAIQRLLERDARGGTRYTEKVRAHFGVVSPDARLQRPEYLGGGSSPVGINPVAQTTATGLSGGSTPQGNLAAIGTGVAQHGFSQSFTEHGYIIGLVNVRADLNYQQGLRRMWSRQTQYDFYFPAFAHLGEQAILNKEIYCTGLAADDDVFGYQERWAEYRYHPAYITSLMRSTAAGTIDAWHLAQRFTSLPTLNQTFIEDTPPLSRVLAVGTGANGQQLICDAFFQINAARPMPMYSVPGLIDHF